MKERDTIEMLLRHRTASPKQRNAPFESDAEIFDAGGRLLAVTVDELSAEDGLSANDLRLHGANLATAVLSDLIAVGADPAFFLQSLAMPDEWGASGLAELSAGIGEALRAFGTALLGGDTGSAPEWRYTGVGIGTFPEGREPLTRVSSTPSGILAVTGNLGDANAAAFRGVSDPRFECRVDESRLARDTACGCIDTSDGLAAAVLAVASVNPSLRFVLDAGAVPLHPDAAQAAAEASIPPGAFLLGGAGEYELLFLLPDPWPEGEGPFTVIGRFETSSEGGVAVEADGRLRPLEASDMPDPRGGNREDYVRSIIELAAACFGGSPCSSKG